MPVSRKRIALATVRSASYPLLNCSFVLNIVTMYMCSSIYANFLARDLVAASRGIRPSPRPRLGIVAACNTDNICAFLDDPENAVYACKAKCVDEQSVARRRRSLFVASTETTARFAS